MSFPKSAQMTFDWDLPEEEISSALSAEEVQLRKDLARAFIENPETWEKDEGGKPITPYWWDSYVRLHEVSHWPFRVAVLTAWLDTPRKYRWPKTQDQLADMLGLTSDRQFSVWMARNPQIKAFVHSTWQEKALDRLSDTMEAMFTVAAMPDYKGKGDRELHLKVAKVLSDVVVLDKTGNVDLSKLSFDEKLRLAGLDNPEALIALRAELAKRRAELEKLSDEEENAPPSAEAYLTSDPSPKGEGSSEEGE